MVQLIFPGEEHPQQQPPLQPALSTCQPGTLGYSPLQHDMPAMQDPPLQRPALRQHALLKDTLVMQDGILHLVVKGQVTDKRAHTYTRYSALGLPEHTVQCRNQGLNEFSI